MHSIPKTYSSCIIETLYPWTDISPISCTHWPAQDCKLLMYCLHCEKYICLWFPCECVCVSCLVVPTLCSPIDCIPPGPSVHGIFQARTLEWVAISFYKRNYRKKESEVTQLCPTLCDPVDYSLPGFPIHGVFRARILEWVTISFSTDSLVYTHISALIWMGGRWEIDGFRLRNDPANIVYKKRLAFRNTFLNLWLTGPETKAFHP